MQIKNGKYRIRNYNITDYKNYARLYSIAAVESKEEYLGISPKQIQLRSECSGNSFFQNLFLVEKNKEIIGSLFVVPERKIGRVILYCFINPFHRRKKIGDNLFTIGLKHARALSLSTAHVNVCKDNSTGIAFLDSLGFGYVRKYLEMEKSLVGAGEQVADLPAGFYYRCLQSGEEKKLAYLQNHSFQDSWGFNPNTADDVKLWICKTCGSPEDIILAFSGEKPVGYCWTLIDRKKRIGKIYMIGVKPAYRGNNLGKALLAKGLNYLAKKGIHTAVLTVDNENEPAKTLYNSVGFNVINTTLWFEKKIG
ncbi:MAG: Mycothiol acetyltransferase [Anaerolineaceae bacterium 46_22]|jgi:mycothiol synthase|nr:MAG: Mycothiol acetyltransferase [Anaerolineaceae bacterium 46_22]